jgi:hypothetical protein
MNSRHKQAIESVLKEMNWYANIFGKGEVVPFPTNAEECGRIRSFIEGQLSPENLHCDGEADPMYVRQRYNELNTAWDALALIDGNQAEPMV